MGIVDIVYYGVERSGHNVLVFILNLHVYIMRNVNMQDPNCSSLDRVCPYWARALARSGTSKNAIRRRFHTRQECICVLEGCA